MKLTGRFKYLGLEKGKTKEGKEYSRLGILQGMKSETLFPSEEIIQKVEKLPCMSDVDCTLSIYVKADKTAYVAIDDITLATK